MENDKMCEKLKTNFVDKKKIKEIEINWQRDHFHGSEDSTFLR